MKLVDIGRLCAYLSGGALTLLATATVKMFPMYETQIMFGVAVVLFVSGFVTNIVANPTGKPARAVVQGAVIVPAGTQTVTPQTTTLGTVAEQAHPPQPPNPPSS